MSSEAVPLVAVVRYSEDVNIRSARSALRLPSRQRYLLIAAAGILLGFMVALAATHNESANTQTTSTVTLTRDDDSEQVARLKVRNRRLEALVTVLKARGESHARVN